MAVELEYYVYGDFEAIVSAFKMVAAIFTDNTFAATMTIVALTTILLIAFHVKVEAMFGAKMDDRIWMKKFIYGVLLYSALMVPTATMHIYDPVKNKYQAVGGVPLGVALIAGGTSIMTREITDMIEGVGSPILGYNEIGMGDGFELLAVSSNIGNIASSIDPLLTKTIDKYIYNCYDQAYVRGHITDKDVYHSTDLLQSMKVDYRVFMSDIFDDAHPGGVLTECADVWVNINNRAKALTLTDEAMKVFCDRVGYDSTDASDLNNCKNKFSGLVAAFASGGSTDLKTYIASAYMARRYIQPGLDGNIYNAIEIAETQARASDYVGSNMAMQYIPKLQGLVATILIASFIVVALFFYVAPAEAFVFYLGLWLWLMLWITMDSILNCIIQQKAFTLFRHIRDSGGMGLTAMFNTGDDAVKTLSMYGQARWMGMSLAGVFAVGIFKMGGGSVFAGFTRMIGASYMNSAASMGSQLGTPQDQAALQNKLYDGAAKAMPLSRMNNMSTYNTDTGGTIMERTADLQYKQGMAAAYGGNWSAAGSSVAGAETVQQLKSIGMSEASMKAASQSGYSIQTLAGAGEFKQQMQNAGIWKEVESGRVTGADIMKMGKYGLLDEQGRKNAAEKMEKVTGKSYDEVAEYMKTGEGMRSYFRYQNAEEMAGRLNMPVSELYRAQENRWTVPLTAEQARNAGVGTVGGNYDVAWNSNGELTFSKSESGQTGTAHYKEFTISSGKAKDDIQLKGATVEYKGEDQYLIKGLHNGREFEMLAYGKEIEQTSVNPGGKGTAHIVKPVSMTEKGNMGNMTVMADGKSVNLTGAEFTNKNGTWTITGQSGGKSREFVGTGDFDDKGNFVFKTTSVNTKDVDKSDDTNLGTTLNTKQQVLGGMTEDYNMKQVAIIADGQNHVLTGANIHNENGLWTFKGQENGLFRTITGAGSFNDKGVFVFTETSQNSADKNNSFNYNSGSNYDNVFQGGLDKNESEKLAEAAWDAAWNKDSSWVKGKDGQLHLDKEAFGKNLAIEIRQQTADMNNTIGGFLRNTDNIDSRFFGGVSGGVQGSIGVGTPGAVSLATGVSANVTAHAESQYGWGYESKSSYTADEVYRTVQADHLKAIDVAKTTNGFDKNKFVSDYSRRLNETATNYDEASKHAPSVLKGDIPKAPEKEPDKEPMKIPEAPKSSLPSMSLYNLVNEKEPKNTPSMGKSMPTKKVKK